MIWKLLWLFLIYSFAGWVLETVLASLKQKKFANRGIINGPFCLIYGFRRILHYRIYKRTDRYLAVSWLCHCSLPA